VKQSSFDSFIKQRDQLALHKISNSKDLRGKNRNDSEDYLGSIDSVSRSVASFSLGQALNPNYIKNKGGSKFLKDTLVYLVKDSLKEKKYEDFLKGIKEDEIIQNADNIDEFLLEKIKENKNKPFDTFNKWLENSIKNSKIIYDIAREGVEQSTGAYEKQYIKPEKLINFVQNKNFCDVVDLQSIIKSIIFKKKQDPSDKNKKQKITSSSNIANLEKISQILRKEEVERLIKYINSEIKYPEEIRNLVLKVLQNPKIIPSLGYAKVLNNPNLANLFNKVVKFKPPEKSDEDSKNSFTDLTRNIDYFLKQPFQGHSNELSFRTKLKAFQGQIDEYRNKIKQKYKGNINQEELNVELLDIIKGSGLHGKMIHDLHEIAESMTEHKLIGATEIADGIKDYIEHICGGRLISDSEFEKQFFKDGKIQHNGNPDSWISSDSKVRDSGIRNFVKKVANGVTSSFNLNNRNGANKNTKAVGIAISVIVALIALITLLTNPGFAAMSITAKVLGIITPLALPVLTTGLTMLSTLRGNRKISKNSSKFIENGLDLVKNTQNIPISRQNSRQSTAQSTESSVNSLDSSYIGEDYNSKTQNNRHLKSLTDGGESLYNESFYGNSTQDDKGKKQTEYFDIKNARLYAEEQERRNGLRKQRGSRRGL
jgi:hypothetical protein